MWLSRLMVVHWLLVMNLLRYSLSSGSSSLYFSVRAVWMSFAQAVLLSDANCSFSACSFASCSSLSFHSLASFSFFLFFFCFRCSSAYSFSQATFLASQSESFLVFFGRDWQSWSSFSWRSWMRSLPMCWTILSTTSGFGLEAPLGVPLFPEDGFFFFRSSLSGFGSFSGEGIRVCLCGSDSRDRLWLLDCAHDSGFLLTEHVTKLVLVITVLRV